VALHPLPAAGIEHRLQLLYDKGHIAAAPEHRGNHPGERHGPGEVLHVFRIDKNFEGAALPVLHDVIHGDVDGVVGFGPLQFVGDAIERRVALHDGHIPVLGHRGGRQHGSGHLVGTEGGASLEAQVIGFAVDILEAFEIAILGHIDGFRNGTVDVFLNRGLHDEVFVRGEIIGGDESRRQRRVGALEVPPEPGGIVIDAQGHAAVVGEPHLALIAHAENGFDAARDISGEKRNGAGGSNGGEQPVAQAR